MNIARGCWTQLSGLNGVAKDLKKLFWDYKSRARDRSLGRRTLNPCATTTALHVTLLRAKQIINQLQLWTMLIFKGNSKSNMAENHNFITSAPQMMEKSLSRLPTVSRKPAENRTQARTARTTRRTHHKSITNAKFSACFGSNDHQHWQVAALNQNRAKVKVDFSKIVFGGQPGNCVLLPRWRRLTRQRRPRRSHGRRTRKWPKCWKKWTPLMACLMPIGQKAVTGEHKNASYGPR